MNPVGSYDYGNYDLVSSQVKLNLGRVAPSAIGWYQQGPCVSYAKNFKVQITLSSPTIQDTFTVYS